MSGGFLIANFGESTPPPPKFSQQIYEIWKNSPAASKSTEIRNDTENFQPCKYKPVYDFASEKELFTINWTDIA